MFTSVGRCSRDRYPAIRPGTKCSNHFGRAFLRHDAKRSNLGGHAVFRHGAKRSNLGGHAVLRHGAKCSNLGGRAALRHGAKCSNLCGRGRQDSRGLGIWRWRIEILPLKKGSFYYLGRMCPKNPILHKIIANTPENGQWVAIVRTHLGGGMLARKKWD